MSAAAAPAVAAATASAAVPGTLVAILSASPRAAPSAPALPWGGSPWAVAAFVFALVACAWPLTAVFAARIGSGGAALDISSVAMLWRLRLRVLFAKGSLDEISIEVRLLHLFTVRKEYPSVSLDWRRWTPVWRIVSEWEAGLQEAGDGRESDDVVTWARLKQWLGAWKRRRPATQALAAGARFVRRRLTVKSLNVAVRVGLGDAAATAWAHGLAWAVFGGAWGGLQRQVKFRTKPAVAVTPLYNRRGFRLSVEGEASLRQIEAAAGLVVAVLAYARHKLSEVGRDAQTAARRAAAKSPG